MYDYDDALDTSYRLRVNHEETKPSAAADQGRLALVVPHVLPVSGTDAADSACARHSLGVLVLEIHGILRQTVSDGVDLVVQISKHPVEPVESLQQMLTLRRLAARRAHA